jgi:hypothetical protein
MTDDDAARDLVVRLARRHPSGGAVIERAAILAAGADLSVVLAWIEAHEGLPEAQAVTTNKARGLHGGRLSSGGAGVTSAPRRYVLPPGALS